MSFERTCVGYRDFRVGPGDQHCERCGEVTKTLWRWTESRPISPFPMAHPTFPTVADEEPSGLWGKNVTNG